MKDEQPLTIKAKNTVFFIPKIAFWHRQNYLVFCNKKPKC